MSKQEEVLWQANLHVKALRQSICHAQGTEKIANTVRQITDIGGKLSKLQSGTRVLHFMS